MVALDEDEDAHSAAEMAAREKSGFKADLCRHGKSVTSSPFLDPSGMLGFLTLASPERVFFTDGKEAPYGRADRVRAEAGRFGHIGGRDHSQLGIAELRRLRISEEENSKLKQLVGGQRIRLLERVDNHSRESLAIEVGQRLTGDDIVRVLE